MALRVDDSERQAVNEGACVVLPPAGARDFRRFASAYAAARLDMEEASARIKHRLLAIVLIKSCFGRRFCLPDDIGVRLRDMARGAVRFSIAQRGD